MSERKIPKCPKCKKRMELKHIVENEHTESLNYYYGCNCGTLKKVDVSKEDNFVIKCEVCKVSFKNLPSCKPICPYKISDQFEIYSINKKDEKIPNTLDKWIKKN